MLKKQKFIKHYKLLFVFQRRGFQKGPLDDLKGFAKHFYIFPHDFKEPFEEIYFFRIICYLMDYHQWKHVLKMSFFALRLEVTVTNNMGDLSLLIKWLRKYWKDHVGKKTSIYIYV